MATKKTRKTKKDPEQSISEKVNYYKGINRTLRKRIDNLEKRMFALEQKIPENKIESPKIKKHTSDTKKHNLEEARQRIIRKFNLEDKKYE